MSTLISFLGKSRADTHSGYRTARYRFDDGHVEETPYFGLALCAHIRPTRLILLGTAASMWDVFFEQLGEHDAAVLELIDAVSHNAVTAAQLRAREPQLGEQLGCRVHCELIPYARDTAEQAAILQRLGTLLTPGEEVVIDVTHGFRHLPMLAQVAARYLARVRGIRVTGLYYGALEMTADAHDGLTPVLRLDGMLDMLDWVEALAGYDKDGDYGVFAPLLERDGMDARHTAQLRTAAFQERVSNPAGARAALSTTLPALEQHTGPLGELFRDEIRTRTHWTRLQTQQQWELALADRYRARGDYVRAAILLYEAFTTELVWRDKGDPGDYEVRKKAQEAGREKMSATAESAFRQLGRLRNNLAHGVRAGAGAGHSRKNAELRELERAFAADDALQALLDSLRATLLKELPIKTQ